MARHVSASQIRSRLRQAQAKQRQTIQKRNNAARTYNNKARQQNSAQRRAIDAYNREVRAHNSRARANQARLKSALQSLSRQPVIVRYTSLHQSVSALSAAYDRLNTSDADPFLSDLAEQDTANSATVLNNLLGDRDFAHAAYGELTSNKIAGDLASISTDLNDRWTGAIFALNPGNPDAARHFCASSREIVAEILNTNAPDEEVRARFPNCQVTQRGTPTRRAKILYCLDRTGVHHEALEDFIEADIKDLSVLFNDLNAGAHGPAGRFPPSQLVAIKTRVEDAIAFILEIAP